MVTSTSRWYALAAMALSTLAVGLDTTVLSVALPTLARDLDASTGDLQWFTTAYLLVLAAALLPAGLLGDRLGRKRLLIGALVLFGAASVACAYAQTSGQLIAARAVLGLGAAVIMPLSGAVLTTLFDNRERGRAMSIWVTASALGIPLGPLLGGWLLDNFWWGSVFLINVPVVIAGVVALALWLPSSRGESSRIDVAGMLLSAAGLVGITYGIIEAGSRGWTDPRSLLTIAAGIVLLVVFVLWQRRAASPLVDLALFRNRAFTGGAVLATVASFAMLGLLFSLPQLFSAVGGHDAFGSGIRLLPVIGGLIVGARAGEKLAAALGARLVIAGGLLAIAVASVLGAQTSATTGYGYIAVWITLTGLGLGLTMPPALNAAIGALTPARAGIGNALLQALRQVGGAVGVAVLGTVLNSAYRSHVPGSAPAAVRESVTSGVSVAAQTGDAGLGQSVREAFTYGMDRSLLVAGALALAGVVLALVMMPARPAEDQPEVLAESLV
ncbi:DHA2 family efflux MFS transporter permease subunit [Paractinoplanes lichenicola]|uniref:DHA2 family efflux MFS transporter permease subunit n=1 Tax=Paractinoplanes lichenicola TaxID=2802976 RepID=A0ABS1VVC9_9ACTN|nr:DHA2 family efflux MFS transporter permease subunit [Actinoplanes lichenicola]MBL7258420.1 DHA2 family efflux MFS transporter permease subunit [Actinoplanes lichenicola]